VLLPHNDGKDYDLQMSLAKVDCNFRPAANYEKPPNKCFGELPYHLPREIAALFPKSEDSWLLEIGCGRAQNREFFESRGYRYVGVDIRPDGPDVVCDAHFLPFKDEAFKSAVTFSTLEHLWNPFIAVSEIYRVLARNCQFDGEAAFLEPFHANSFFHMSPVGLEACLRQVGFCVEKIWPGWGVGESLGHYMFKQLHMQLLGRALGRVVDKIHECTFIACNFVRGITGRSRRSREDFLLTFAGSVNWISVKPDGTKRAPKRVGGQKKH
jgi:SAM-dependent methyltransferase